MITKNIDKIILFASMKGGSGRTTAASNVGFLLARSGYRVLLIDGDVEAPGISLLKAFQPISDYSYGKGLVHLINHYIPDKKKEKTSQPDNINVLDFIHPVLLGSRLAKSNHRGYNTYFDNKHSQGSPRVKKVLDDFSPSGELWVMPAYENAVQDALNWDDLHPVVAHLFAGHRRSVDKKNDEEKILAPVINTLKYIVQQIVASSGKAKGSKPFDYVLIDTRSGLDPWTLYVLLPMAGQIALAAQLNEQGSCETAKFVEQIHSDEFLNDIDPSGTPSITPIKWFSQILPAGENSLRERCIDDFLSKINNLSNPKIPHLDYSDIVQIFYNSSLPLQEDIRAVDVDPYLYQGEPYWQLTDQLCSVYDDSLLHIESDILQILDDNGNEYFSDKAVDRLVKNNLFLGILQKLIPRLERLSFYEPRSCLNYLNRLGSRYLFRQSMLGFYEKALESEEKKNAERYFELFVRLSTKTTGTLFLSQLLEAFNDYAESNCNTPGIIKTQEDEIIKLEGASHTIHIATRRFLYDQHSDFQGAVKDNLLAGKAYHYYASDAYGYASEQDGSADAWESVCGIMHGWCQTAEFSDIKTVRIDRQNPTDTEIHWTLPEQVQREHALPPDVADLVIYMDEQGQPQQAVIFPKDPKDTEAEYLLIKNADLAKVLYRMLRMSRLTT